MKKALSAVALAAALCSMSSVALADDELYAGGGAGGNVAWLVNQGGSPAIGAFQLREEFGWHVSGNAEGFFLGLVVGEAFGDGFWRVSFHPRIGYDITVHDAHGFAFQIGPWAMVPGVTLASAFQGGSIIPYFDMLFGADFRLLFLDRTLAVALRPGSVAISVGGDGPGVFVAYEGMALLYVNFP